MVAAHPFALRLARLAAAVAGVGLLWAAASEVASADPDLGPVIDTTCDYSQVMAALHAQSPAAATGLESSPTAQALVRSFLASSPEQRRQIAQELQASPGAQQYIGTVLQVADTCNNY